MKISAQEDLSLPEPLAARIVAASGRDMRKALLCLECCRVQQFPFSESQQPRLADWELYIMVRKAQSCRSACRPFVDPYCMSRPRIRMLLAHTEIYAAFDVQEIASDILTEQTPKKLLQVRGKIYELLVNVVPPELIIRHIATELIKKLDDEVKHEVCGCHGTPPSQFR